MMRLGRLTSLLIIELAVMVGIALAGDLRRHVPLFLLLFGAAAISHLAAVHVARTGQIRLRFILVWLVLLRVPMFATAPSLSDDVWRYLHDGRAQLAGVNPYRYAPGDTATLAFRGAHYTRINHPDLPTIYPPVAQLAFRIAAGVSDPLIVWRLLLLLAELAALIAGAVLIRRRNGNVANLAIYAWHPLAIVESIGSAHLDAIGIAFMVASLALFTRGSKAGAGLALAASVGAKLIAAPIALFMTRGYRLPLILIAGLTALYLPYALDTTSPFGSLATFAQRWESNGSVYAVLAPLLGARGYRLLALLGLIALVAILRWKRVEITTAALMYFLALFLLAPVLHPWYLLWLLVLVPLRKDPLDSTGLTALVWTTTVVLAYVAHHEQLISGAWRIPLPVLLLEYAPVYTLLGITLARMRSRSRTSIRAP